MTKLKKVSQPLQAAAYINLIKVMVTKKEDNLTKEKLLAEIERFKKELKKRKKE